MQRRFIDRTVPIRGGILPAVLFAASASAQTHLIVPDSNSDTIVLLDPFDGSIVDAAFIADDPAETLYDFELPKDVVQVNDELWVVDQNSDQIIRFDLQGNHVATIFPAVGMIDNSRGACFANNTFYVAADGTANGAPGNAVVMFDTTGMRLGHFIVGGSSPFDVFEYNGELLVPDFTDDTIRRYDYAGLYLGDFHLSDGVNGIDNIEQLNLSASGGVLAAGFTSPSGVYEYDSLGMQTNYWPGGGGRGVHELGNGNIAFTTGALSTLDRGTGTFTTISSGGFHFINPVTLPESAVSACFGDGGDQLGCTSCPCGNNAALGAGGGCLNSGATSARLVASGTPDVSTPADTLHFDVLAANVSTFGILVSGSAQLPNNPANPCFTQNPGSGVTSVSLDGLRCIGGASVIRHGSRASDVNGDIGITTNGWGPPNNPLAGIGITSGFVSGQTRFFQVFYRENAGSVCLTGQNTTQSVAITFL